MKTYRGVDVQPHAFLTSALHGGKWSVSKLNVRIQHRHPVGGSDNYRRI